MKNFTDIITMAFMAAAVSASAQVGVMPPKAPLQAGTPNNAAPVASFNPIPTALQQVMTNILFYEDFANGFTGNNGVGSWTAEDTGGGLIWQAVNEAGDGYFADGTASGVQPPAGEFSTNIGTLNSTTAANGWMVYDNATTGHTRQFQRVIREHRGVAHFSPSLDLSETQVP